MTAVCILRERQVDIMFGRNKKINTIREQFTMSMTYILLFELFIFAIFMFFGGTLGMIVNNVYSNLKDTAQIRTNSLQDGFNSVSDTAVNSYDIISGMVPKDTPYDEAACNKAFIELMPHLQTISAGENITGAFIVMGSDLNSSRLPAVYIRKTNGAIKNQRYSIMISSSEVLEKSGMLMDRSWSSSINIDPKDNTDNLDYLSEPIRLSAEYKDIEATKLGYWSMPYQINYDGNYVIAYTMPLRDESGSCIGVYGIEMSLEHVREKLPYLELNSKGMGNYVLLCRDSDRNAAYKKVVVSGDTFNRLNSYSETVAFKKNLVENGILVVDTPKKNSSDIYAIFNEMSVWKNCKYDHNVWVLCGVVDSVYLKDLEQSIRFSVLLVFALTMFLGLIFAWIVSSLMAAPIHKFLGEIKKIRADNPVMPSQSSISEINDLAKVVENLTDDITDFSVKVSTIIDLAGLQFGAFEYDTGSDFVYCTDMLFSLLALEKSGDKLFVPKKEFEEKMQIFNIALSPDIDQVYKMKMPSGGIKYFHLKTALINGKILGVIQDTTTETVTERARKLAQDHDPMTNLLNRAAFRHKLDEVFESDKSAIAALVHLNIDKMSEINVRLGNETGDKFIYGVSAVLKRYEDKTNSYASRSAGDEFKYLIVGSDREKMEEQLENMFRDIYALKIPTSDGVMDVPISVGVAWYPFDTTVTGTLEQYAEFAMNQVKSKGGNGSKFFDKIAYEEAEKYIRSNRDIEALITAGLIRYAFQPIVNVRTGEIYGYEALMRPTSKNAVSPHDVIVFATEQNKLDIIEKITWFTALEDFSAQTDTTNTKKVFINSIPSQLLSPEEFGQLEDRYGEYLGNIVLEIIENEQTDPVIIDKKKAIVEKWGCMLALDDYGSGYANDNTLLSLKPNLIKLDIEMITGIEEDSDRQTLVTNIIDYAHQRDIVVLAEGIETYTQMETLIGYGVDLMQGFYLAKPNFDVVDNVDPRIKSEILEIRQRLGI